ncbi:MAG: hypothetical protein IKF91_02365 [Bacilli bacterium]|nr:hypothetical protein [Bacilli bacterium]
MSHNTNTLFWVITGAVVVLGIFTLVNFSQDKSLKRINGTFDSYWTGQDYDEEDYSQYFAGEEVDPHFSIPRYSCGSNVGKAGGYRVEVHDFHDSGTGESMVRWIITNKNDTTNDKLLWVKFYDCATDNEILSGAWWVNDIQPKQTIQLWTWGGSLLEDFTYYIKVELEG